jgi:uncharacterized protein involved in type VI secretion and phage assembly
MSLAEILKQSKKQESLILGVVSGVVTNNQDPDKLGRIKVKLPRISGEDESNWARVISFMAGQDRGAFYLPEVDDEVLVAFEYGDINQPYVLGSLWNGVDTPPEDNGDGENNIRVIKSRSGHVVRLDDTDGAEKIEIIDKSENNLITIDTSENKITISSDQDIDILAPSGKVLIDANEFEIKSAGDSKIESGANLDVNASGDLNAAGATINLN